MKTKAAIRWLRRRINAIQGRDFFVEPDVELSVKRLGSDYGGWQILPSLLNQDSVVYSFGAGEDITFDEALCDEFGCAVHLFDPTPKAKLWFDKTNCRNRLKFYEWGLWEKDGYLSFHSPKNSRHVSMSILEAPHLSGEAISLPVRSLQSTCDALGHDRIDLMKIDIEGSEYSVVDSMILGAIRPTQLLIEFHHRFPTIGISKSINSIKSIRGAGYKLFSVSSSGEEYSFVRSSCLPKIS